MKVVQSMLCLDPCTIEVGLGKKKGERCVSKRSEDVELIHASKCLLCAKIYTTLFIIDIYMF